MMPPLITPTKDFYMEVARGNVPGMSTVVVRGHNDDLDSGVEEELWHPGGDLTYLTTAETMNIVSTSTSDDGAPAGIGLQTVLVSGVDNTGALLTETVTLNGTTDVLTSGSFLRVNFLVGLAVGSTGWNVGDITATSSSAATVQCSIDATEGISQNSHYTVPLAKTLHVMQLEFNCANNTARDVIFKVYVRSGGADNCWLQLFNKTMDTGVVDELDVTLPFPSSSTQAIARTDFRTRAIATGNNTIASMRMYGILIDD